MTVRTYGPGEPFNGVVGRTVAESVPAYPAPVRPPTGAPNVVVVLLDDVGFAQFGCFGSSIDTPTFDRLAAGGLRYRNFHTTAMCSPTRAALLTGRNHHTAGMGGIADQATGFPGYDGRIGKDTGFLSEVLVEQGYATFAVGKWHLAPREESDLAAPRARWPLARGFERFYGFLGAETNQYAPDLVADNHFVDPPKSPAEGYHLTEDLVDHAIEYINDLRNVTVDKPFFLYLTPGACHAPHQAPPEFIARYEGRFDHGWDADREAIHARQLEMGVLPPGTGLTPRPHWIPAWDALGAEERRVYARAMEVFAAFLTHTDHHVGRLVEHLRRTGDLDNTIFLVSSDNGTSPEGGMHGMSNVNRWYNQNIESFDDVAARVDTLGGPDSFGHYPYGWAHAGNTPFQKWKREVHEGGVADPLIVHWPVGIPEGERGAVRGQYAHAIDITPTILDAIGLRFPDRIDGVPQKPVAGTSLRSTFGAGGAAVPELHVTQYYELLGCRAIYHDGWKAVAYHATAAQVYDGVSDPDAPIDADRWELYHIAEDFSECHDLAAARPEKLREMVDRWWVEAGTYGVLPVHTRRPVHNNRPSHLEPRERYVYRPGACVATTAAVDLLHRAHVVGVDCTRAAGDHGVLLAHGGRFGGYSLYVQDEALHYVHNHLGAERFRVSSGPLPEGEHILGFSFAPTGFNEGDITLLVDHQPVATGHIPRMTPNFYAVYGDHLCLGFDDGTPVDDRYESPYRFSGEVRTAVVDVSGAPFRDLAATWEALRASQ
jgi:arylsulfatase A-like enzyme